MLITPMRTDNASLTFFRQRIAEFLSPRTARASLRWVAEATAVRDPGALGGSRSPAACVRASVPVTPWATSQSAGETRVALPDHRPAVSLARDEPDRQGRPEPPQVGVESVGSGRHSRV